MKINKTIETEGGTLVFSGELTDDEVDFVIEMGLVYMIEHDMLPFMGLSEQDTDVVVSAPSGSLQ